MKLKSLKTAALILLGILLALLIKKLVLREEPVVVRSPLTAPVERIPLGIIVTESTSGALPPAPTLASAPADRLLADYASPNLPPRNDVLLLSHLISDFLIIHKQAADRPLSANEEWSAALRGQRPGTELWLSANSRAFDSQQRLVDRWGAPLHFHALGGKQWEIRSAGPDHKLWTPDDLLENTSGTINREHR